MRVLIVGNGSDVNSHELRELQGDHDLVVATDGAVHRIAADIAPDIICGDFDSIDLPRARESFPDAEYFHLPSQDSCDLEKAIELALDRGAATITLVGFFGGGIDFSFATFSVLLRYHARVSLSARHKGSSVWLVDESSRFQNPLRFHARPDDTVSILSVTPVTRVSVTNVFWPLDNEVLEAGSRGVSNKALGGVVEVTVTEGAAIVCWLPVHEESLRGTRE